MLLKQLHTSDKAGGSQTHFIIHKTFAGLRTCRSFAHWILIATTGRKHRKTGSQQITTCTTAGQNLLCCSLCYAIKYNNIARKAWLQSPEATKGRSDKV